MITVVSNDAVCWHHINDKSFAPAVSIKFSSQPKIENRQNPIITPISHPVYISVKEL